MASSAAVYRERILKESLVRTLFWLAWPVIVAELVQMTYNLVDALWLGRLGRQAFGAPTVSWPLIMLFNAIGMGFAQAGMTLISQYYGAGDREMSNRCACQIITLLTVLALSISVLGVSSVHVILKIMRVPEDIYPLAVMYSRVIFAGIPIAFLGFAFLAILDSLGDTRTSMKLSVFSAIMNIVLDPILIFGLFGLPALGVVGAAIATLLSRCFITIVGIRMLTRGIHGIKLRLRCMRIEGWWLRRVISIGVPITIQMSSNALGFTVMTSIVSWFGSVAVAAYGIGIRIIDIIQAFTWGIQRATSIMIGQCIGAELYERAKRISRTSLVFTTLVLGIGAAILYVLREAVISIFVPDPLVIREGSVFLRYFLWSIPFFGIFFVCNGVAQGSGHPKVMTVIAILRLWLFRIGLSVLFTLYLGMGSMGVWIAMTISNIAAGLLSLAWILRGTWLRRVIEPRKLQKPQVVQTPLKTQQSHQNPETESQDSQPCTREPHGDDHENNSSR